MLAKLIKYTFVGKTQKSNEIIAIKHRIKVTSAVGGEVVLLGTQQSSASGSEYWLCRCSLSELFFKLYIYVYTFFCMFCIRFFTFVKFHIHFKPMSFDLSITLCSSCENFLYISQGPIRKEIIYLYKFGNLRRV